MIPTFVEADVRKEEQAPVAVGSGPEDISAAVIILESKLNEHKHSSFNIFFNEKNERTALYSFSIHTKKKFSCSWAYEIKQINLRIKKKIFLLHTYIFSITVLMVERINFVGTTGKFNCWWVHEINHYINLYGARKTNRNVLFQKFIMHCHTCLHNLLDLWWQTSWYILQTNNFCQLIEYYKLYFHTSYGLYATTRWYCTISL